MAKKVSDLSIGELTKVIASAGGGQHNVVKLVARMLNKAFDEGYDEADKQGWRDTQKYITRKR